MAGGQDILRFITCGSVDDGKSTLIGRLLLDTGAIPDDQRAILGGADGEIDPALLLDGLSAEREQGITIDVAYRFFETKLRKFIIADTPGHEQYTRNMVTGCSTADAAILVIDARKGPSRQTLRHGYIAHLLGIDHLIIAVSKMDMAGHSEAVFEGVRRAVAALSGKWEGAKLQLIPMSGLTGGNVAVRCKEMPWYRGPTLLEALESLPERGTSSASAPFRMPVQLVARPDDGSRLYSGLVVSGSVAPGVEVIVQPGGARTRVSEIVAMGGPQEKAVTGESVSLRLEDAVDCGRGSILASATDPLEAADQFEADIIWMGEAPMLPGRPYALKIGTRTVTASITGLKAEIDPETLRKIPARSLALNGIGLAMLSLDEPVAFAPYAENRDLGGFILIDRESKATVGAGLIRHALRRAHNISWQTLDVTREAHAALKNQQPRLLWFTGLPGAGKTTIANLVEKKLHALGKHSFLLDGDNVRHGLNRDLGFTDADRVENIRRVGEVARLMTDAGLIVLAAFISPFRAERAMVRRLLPDGEFVEIFIDTPLHLAEERDPKGLYRKARAGALLNFTGIDSAYEPPDAPEIRIDTTSLTAEEAAERIVRHVLGEPA
jgi:bifunctional enzyme CysN/CysC